MSERVQPQNKEKSDLISLNNPLYRIFLGSLLLVDGYWAGALVLVPEFYQGFRYIFDQLDIGPDEKVF